MGLLTANQVNRKVLYFDSLTIGSPTSYPGSVPGQIADYIVLGGSLANTDAADQFVEFALGDLLGTIVVLGSVVVPAPVLPADDKVVNLGDPAGDFSLAGLVVPAGWALQYRCQPGFTTGELLLGLTLGAV